MFSWNLLFGGLIWIILCRIISKITTNYLWELTDKVMNAYGNERYARMLWYNIKIKDTKLNQFLINVTYTIFWPVVCIAAILKAESNYDRIMRRNAAFKRRVP